MASEPRPDVADLFRVRCLAVVGASERNPMARSVLQGLHAIGFPGTAVAVHPRAEPVRGFPAYPSLAAVPEPVDAAVLVIGRERVPQALEECAAAGVRAVTILAGGFAEAGEEGAALQRAVVDVARRHGVAVCGPNCLGYASFHDRISTYASPRLPTRAGNVGLVSHSGGLLNEVLAYGAYRGLGFSRAISAGNEAVLDLAAYVEFLAADPVTEVIGLVVEALRGPERLRAALDAAAAARKPVVVLKMGLSPLAAHAARTHTGAMVGSADAFAALCKQYGLTAAEDVDELCEALVLFSRAGHLVRRGGAPRGAAVVEISGGGKELVCDLAHRHGVELATLSPETSRRVAALPTALPVVGENPVDMGGSWEGPEAMECHRLCLAAMADDPAVDVIASRLTVPSEGDARSLLAHGEIVAAARAEHPERLFLVLGRASGRIHDEWRAVCATADVPYLQGYGRGLKALGQLAAYRRFLDRRAAAGAAGEGAAPAVADAPGNGAVAPAGGSAQPGAVRVLDEVEAKDVLGRAGLPVNPTRFAPDAAEAVALARSSGFPVVVKGISPRAVHKSDLGLVALGLGDEVEVRRAAGAMLDRLAALGPAGEGGRVGVSVQPMLTPGAEVIVGGFRDPVLGPLVLCGMGGTWAELLADRALRLAPLRREDAEAMIVETRIPRLAAGFRGLPPVDLGALAGLLVDVGRWFAARSEVEEFDLNPVLCSGARLVIADARAVVRAPGA